MPDIVMHKHPLFLRHTAGAVVCLLLLALLAGICPSQAGTLKGWAAYNFPNNTIAGLSDETIPPILHAPTGLRVLSNGSTLNAFSTPQVDLGGSATFTAITPGTLITLTNAPSLVIDLGKTAAVHRIFLSGTNHNLKLWNPAANQNVAPLGLFVVSVGSSMATLKQVATYTIPPDAGNPVDVEAEIRFSPAVGRYVTIVLQTNITWGVNYWPGYAINPQPAIQGLGLNVERLEISGSLATNLGPNAVVCPANASRPLALAAAELSYYLGELSGQPHPIITPDQTNLYPGTIYRIVDLKPLAPDYATMMANIANGSLPDGVNIEVQGREVVFKAWPYRAVLWSVWEFLERQGVRWVYADSHGDYVPTGNGVDLSLLPLKYKPSARNIYANWDVANLQPWPIWCLQSYRQEYLYVWRNRWNTSSGGSPGPLACSEIPAMPKPAITLNSDYSEGLDSYPHNFNIVIPSRILAQHTNWWGYSPTSGTRVSPTTSGAPAFCMDSPEAIQWVANKIIALSQATPVESTAPLALPNFKRWYGLLPLDGTTFCQCDAFCAPANLPLQPSGIAWVKLYTNSFSDGYYKFVNDVAGLVKQSNPSATVGALAYADLLQPPQNITRLGDNVHVEICLYGSPNLPVKSPINAQFKAVLDGWASRSTNLSHYDYTLLHTDYCQTNNTIPVPLVTGIVDHAQYLGAMNALDGGTQANIDSLPFNPWNFYAYPRIRWNTNQTSDHMLTEFFTGYFRQASAPMLAYYKAIENYQVGGDVDMHYAGYSYGVTPGSFPRNVLYAMMTNLTAAESIATDWVTSNRVARVRQGFNSVMTISSLSVSDLTNTANVLPVNPSLGSVSLNLAGMTNTGSTQFTALKQWAYWAAGSIQESLNIQKQGNYKITVVARGVQADGIWPILNVYLGSARQTFTINTTDFAEYTFTGNIPNAVLDFVATYKNSATGGRRNIYIKEVRIAP